MNFTNIMVKEKNPGDKEYVLQDFKNEVQKLAMLTVEI